MKPGNGMMPRGRVAPRYLAGGKEEMRRLPMAARLGGGRIHGEACVEVVLCCGGGTACRRVD